MKTAWSGIHAGGRSTTQPKENTEATPTKMVINVTKLNVRVNKYHYNENNIYTTT